MNEDLRREAWAWWGGRRRQYTVSLLAAGAIAFLLYAAAIEYRCRNDPDAEITVFTTLFQGIAFLVAVGVANLFYNLGPVVETRIGNGDRETYRRRAFRAGLWFSVALPFLIPALVWSRGCR
jgi:hypothetical protein